MPQAEGPPALRQRAARGVLWTVIQTWGARLMGIAVFVVLGRRLDASAFGLMAMAVAVIEFGRLLVDQGFSRSIVQREHIDDDHLDTAFFAAVGVGSVLTLLAILAAPAVATSFGEPDLTSVLRVLSVSFVLTSLTTTHVAILQRRLDFRSLAVRQLVSVAVGGAVGVGLALAGWDVWALVGQHLTQGVVALLILWTASPWRPGFGFSGSRLRQMLSFGATTFMIDLVGYGARRGDDILVGAFFDATTLGFFSVAFKILTIVMELFIKAVNTVAFPVFSRIQSDPARIRRALHTATRTSSALACPAFVALIVLAPQFVSVIFGSKWQESVAVLQIIALTGVLRSVTYFNRALLLGLGKASWELGWVLLYVVTKVIAFAIGQRWGLVGVAWAVVVHAYALAPAGIWLINRATPLQPAVYLRQFLIPLRASLAMAAVLVGVRVVLDGRVAEVVVLLAGIAIGALAYVGALALTAPSLGRELLGELRRAAPDRRDGAAAPPEPRSTGLFGAR